MTQPTTIPILDLTRQYERFASDYQQAAIDVLASGRYILGPNVTAFETEVAQFLGVKHAIGCANGTDALYLSMLALGIGAGDEVITTPFTYIATSESMLRAGATPVLVDVEYDTFNINVAAIEQAITPRTKAIAPVHLYGLPVDMAPLMALAQKHNLLVLEDCAQAIGATYTGGSYTAQSVGTFGQLSGFSFFPTKNLGAFGDGGLMTTNDDALAERVRMLRVHGSRQCYIHELPGINSRLDEIQAALLRIKLPYLTQLNARRQTIAARYTEAFKTRLADYCTPPHIPAGRTHVFHQYTLKLHTTHAAQRDAVQAQLKAEHGVQSMIYYPIPQYEQPTHAHLGYTPERITQEFPVCETLRRQVLSLPVFPELSDDEVQRVIDAVCTVVPQQVKAAEPACV